jgi:hypothetical protein
MRNRLSIVVFMVFAVALSAMMGCKTRDAKKMAIANTMPKAVVNACGSIDITNQLLAGDSISGTTTGQGNKYFQNTGGPEEYDYGTEDPDVMYSFTLTEPRYVYFTTCDGAEWDTFLAIRSVCDDNYDYITYNDDDCAYNASYISTVLGPGTYYLLLDGCCGPGDEGPFTLYMGSGSPEVYSLAPKTTKAVVSPKNK